MEVRERSREGKKRGKEEEGRGREGKDFKGRGRGATENVRHENAEQG